MKGLGTRLLTAAVAIPILVFVVGWLPWYGFGLIAFLALGITFHELFSMTLHQETPAMTWFATGWGLVTLASLVLLWQMPARWGYPHTLFAMPVFFLSMLVLFGVFLFARGRQADLSAVPHHFQAVFFGVLYLSICGAHIILLSRIPDGLSTFRAGWVFLALLTNWGSDTGGFLFGKSIGGPKLYPSVSPNKTWAGLLGCHLGAFLGAWVTKLTVLPQLHLLDCLWISLLVANIGQMGDFFESLFKRAHRVKDTGSILPGHGGLLDRIDSLLVTGPILYYYATWYVLAR